MGLSPPENGGGGENDEEGGGRWSAIGSFPLGFGPFGFQHQRDGVGWGGGEEQTIFPLHPS